MQRTRAAHHRVVGSLGHLVVEVWGGAPPEWEGFAMAERQLDDSLVFGIYAREFREAGYPAASGRLAFAMLLEAEKAARTVPAILGVWHPSSDNFKVYKQLRAGGMDPVGAASRTFTGTEAARHGYTTVASVDEQDDVVRVRFEPPGAAAS